MAFTLTSPVFDNGEAIPAKYTGDGQDISPPLNWSGVPEGTKRFALICDDPDAPAGTWVHWVIWNVPPDQSGLDEAVPTDPQLANGARQGMNDFQSIGYGGPAPPKGPAHRYYFKLYALDTELALQPGASKQQLLDGMEGSILAEAQLMGTYQR